VQEVIKLKNEFYEKWVSPDGLALLNIGDAENSNGILFYAYFIALCREFDAINSLDQKHCNHLLEILQEDKGLLNRRKDLHTLEAHDNYVGAAYCALISGNEDYLENVVKRGVEHGWNYNNVPPYEWRKESQRQGGEIAFYQICAGYTPDVFYFIWMLIGLIIASFQWSSVVNLAWLRCKAIRLALKNPQPAWVSFGFSIAELIFTLLVDSRGGFKKFFKDYYRDTVYGRLSEVVYGN